MGRLLPFRRRRWTRPDDYGFRDPKRAVSPRGLWREFLFWLRPVGLLAGLIITWMAFDANFIEPPTILSSEPEQVSEQFIICGQGRSHGCVVDGDTFRLGDRSVRIIGIDTPETHPARCPEEAQLGEAATLKLKELLNQGPFEMVAPIYRDHDMYGRDLRVIRRLRGEGGYQSIGDDMRKSGLARRYMGGFKVGWC